MRVCCNVRYRFLWCVGWWLFFRRTKNYGILKIGIAKLDKVIKKRLWKGADFFKCRRIIVTHQLFSPLTEHFVLFCSSFIRKEG